LRRYVCWLSFVLIIAESKVISFFSMEFHSISDMFLEAGKETLIASLSKLIVAREEICNKQYGDFYRYIYDIF
jgi:hypothetical protein